MDSSRAEIGSLINYTLDVTNNGPGTADDVVLTDTIPAGLEFVSATWTSPSGSGACTEAAGTVTCGVGALANTEAATAVVETRVVAQGTITNTATATDAGGATFDPVPANSTATVDLDTFYPLPTLHPLALGFLALLLALGGVWVIRR